MSRREQIEGLLADSPEDVFLNYAYAMELAKEGEADSAREVFAKVRKLDPNYVPAYFQEGQMLAQQGDEQAARLILADGIAVAKNVGDDHAHGEMTEFLDGL